MRWLFLFPCIVLFAKIEVVVFDFGGVIAHAEYEKGERFIHPIPGMLALIEELKAAGYQTAMLSNTVPWHAEAIRELGLYRPFSPVVLSYEIGYRKPNPKAYEILLQKLGRPPEETLFIDNKEENVVAARKAGMHAVHFTSCKELRARLSTLLQRDFQECPQ